MKIGGTLIRGGIQDLLIFITGKLKEEEVFLSNKRGYSVAKSDDPIHHFPQQDDTENNEK